MERDHVFLVGMMGAGKTTLGKALARRLGRDFVDTDKVLVERTGVAIATIFEIEGEDGFRRRESAVLAEVAARDTPCVIATGGGAVVMPENRALMREAGTVVYLRARLENLWERTRHDTSRPLLAAPDPRARLAEILAARESLYSEAAHVTVDTGSQSASALVARVVATLGERGAPRGSR